MKYRPFSSYGSAGLLCGSLAAVCFGLEARLNATHPTTCHRPLFAALVFLLGPSCCLMLPGLLVKPSAGRSVRWLIGGFLGAIIMVSARASICVDYDGGPPPP